MAKKKEHKVSIGNRFLYLASHTSFSGGRGEGAAIMYTG